MPNEQSMEQIAETAARYACRETMRLFGVDIEDQEEVNTFRADLIHARRMRQMSDSATGIAFKIVVGAILVSMFAAFWDGIKTAVKHALGLP